MCPTANTNSESVRVIRRGSRRVNIAIEGGRKTIPTANTVIASPERATVVRKPVATSGSRPAHDELGRTHQDGSRRQDVDDERQMPSD